MPRTDKDLMKNPPLKVILIYQAVIDMINEGADINHIKVADLTKRAGIGKGTAYEYFSTKEEIITRALLYELMKSMAYVEQVAYNEEPFQNKIEMLLDYGIEHYHRGRTLFQIGKIVFGSFEISEPLKEQFCTLREENVCKQFLVLQKVIIQAGVRENILKESDPMRQSMVVNSQMISFLLGIKTIQKGESDMSIQELKHFIYENIVKLLG